MLAILIKQECWLVKISNKRKERTQLSPDINNWHTNSSFFNPCSPEGFPQTYFPKGGLLQLPLWIINTEGHITLNLLPVYRYGHPLSIDTKICTNH